MHSRKTDLLFRIVIMTDYSLIVDQCETVVRIAFDRRASDVGRVFCIQKDVDNNVEKLCCLLKDALQCGEFGAQIDEFIVVSEEFHVLLEKCALQCKEFIVDNDVVFEYFKQHLMQCGQALEKRVLQDLRDEDSDYERYIEKVKREYQRFLGSEKRTMKTTKTIDDLFKKFEKYVSECKNNLADVYDVKALRFDRARVFDVGEKMLNEIYFAKN